MFLDILKIISGPLIGSLIGYFTNLIAVKMLFYPRKEITLFHHKLPFTPGVIPKGKTRLAHAIGNAVGDTLITKTDIKARLQSPELINKLIDNIYKKMDLPINKSIIDITNLPESMYEEEKNKIADNISRDIIKSLSEIDYSELINEKGSSVIRESITNPMINMFLTDDMIRSMSNPLGSKIQQTIRTEGFDFVKPFVLEKINSFDENSIIELFNTMNISDLMIKNIISSIIYKVINESITTILNCINISEIVESKINSMDIDELEKLIIQVMKKELNAIVNLGAFIGFVLGLINIFI